MMILATSLLTYGLFTPLPSQVRKLNGPVASGFAGRVLSSLQAPDGSRLVYLADAEQDEVYELFSVPIGGGTATKLNGPLVAGGDVSNGVLLYQISPDSSRVVYLADQDADEVFEEAQRRGQTLPESVFDRGIVR